MSAEAAEAANLPASAAGTDNHTSASNEYSSTRASKFRFKDKDNISTRERSSRNNAKRSTSDHTYDFDFSPDASTLYSSHRRKRHRSSRTHDQHEPSSSHSHRHHRRKHHPSKPTSSHTSHPRDDPSLYDDTYLPNARSAQYMDPDTAFRESLFDALADDEGAAYWEGVYGQPIHVYSSTKPGTSGTGPPGELEQMTDEEYASHVRARMYEKTHQHVIEERQRREEARQRQRAWRDQTRKMEREKHDFDRAVEESLKRGEHRRMARRYREVWQVYLSRWDKLAGGMGQTTEKQSLDDESGSKRSALDTKLGSQDTKQDPYPKSPRSRIPWPVLSGHFRDVNREQVETFLSHVPLDLLPSGSNIPREQERDKNTNGNAENRSSNPEKLLPVLKIERVRWHPDKMQQRFGSDMDEETGKAVTAVFQVVDHMWNEMKMKVQ